MNERRNIHPFIPIYRTSDSFVVRLSFNIMKQLGSRVAFVRVRSLLSDSGLLFGGRDDAFLSALVLSSSGRRVHLAGMLYVNDSFKVHFSSLQDGI